MFSCSNATSSTQSAVAMASYRSGDKLYSLRDGETKNYKERFVKPESFILKPDNAPEWTLERERLWNEVESYECKRDNARLAKNILIALPNDMTAEQQRITTEEFVKENFVEKGMVADVSIHRDDVNNPHAHILTTLREFNEEGEWEKRKSKRVPVLDDEGNQVFDEKGWRKTRSVKLNDFDKRDTLIKWRENWSEKLNEKSREYDLNKLYSEKSFEDQGRLEKAEIRLTRNEYQFERRQKEQYENNGLEYKPTTYYAKKNEEIKVYNQNLSNVIHLEDYKTNRNYNDIFDNIRNSQPYNEDRIESTKMMVDRVKGYVTYSVAKDLYNDFYSETNKWKLKLKRDVTSLNSRKEFYNNLINEYARNKNSVIQYGYTANGFEKEVAKDLDEIGDVQQTIEEEMSKFKELKYASYKAFEYQKDILQQEFYAIYGEANDSLNDDEKNYTIQLMKDYQICLPEDEIKEEYLKSEKRESENVYVPAWKQAKDTIVSLNIYNRTLNKLENVNLDNLTAKNRKENAINHRTFTNLKSAYLDVLSDIEPMINEELKMAFKDIPSSEVLDSISVEVKSALLEKYNDLTNEQKENITFNGLMKETLEEKESQYKAVTQQMSELNHDSKRKDAYKDVANQYDRIVDGLLNRLEEISRTKESDKFRKGGDSTRTYRRRGTDGREL